MEEKFYESIFRYQKILHTKYLLGKLTQDELSHYYHLLHLWSINYRSGEVGEVLCQGMK